MASICNTSLFDEGLFFIADSKDELIKKNTRGDINNHPPEPNINMPIKKPPNAPLKLTDWSCLAIEKIPKDRIAHNNK